MDLPDFSRRDILVAFSAFVLAASVGVFIGDLDNSQRGGFEFDEFMDINLNSSNSVQTLDLENSSVDLLFEGSNSARVYLDTDRDGSADRELNLTHSGQEETSSFILTVDSKSYRAYYRFYDDPETDNDAYLAVYRLSRIQ